MSTEHVANEIHVGGEPPSLTLSEKITNKVVFHNFANLPHQVKKTTGSSKFLCHGKEWFVRLYPGGKKEEMAGYVSLYLHLAGDNRDVKIKVTMRVPSYPLSRSFSFDFKGSVKDYGYGWLKFFKRDQLLQSNALQDGALTVFFDIQVWADTPPVWTPKRNHLYSKMLEMFEAEHRTDVTFTASGESIRAHRLVLECSAPALFALTEDSEEVPIDDIDPTLFRSFLRFLYSEEITDDMKGKAREMLIAADRFGCTRLKLLVESELVSLLNSGNAADFFLFADSHSCGLLREAAFNYIVKNPTGVRQSPSWSEILKSTDLIDEIMNGWFPQGTSTSNIADVDPFSSKSIIELRRLLDAKGLDVDGSRQILIKRLQDAESNASQEGNSRKRRREVDLLDS